MKFGEMAHTDPRRASISLTTSTTKPFTSKSTRRLRPLDWCASSSASPRSGRCRRYCVRTTGLSSRRQRSLTRVESACRGTTKSVRSPSSGSAYGRTPASACTCRRPSAPPSPETSATGNWRSPTEAAPSDVQSSGRANPPGSDVNSGQLVAGNVSRMARSSLAASAVIAHSGSRGTPASNPTRRSPPLMVIGKPPLRMNCSSGNCR